VVKIQHAIQDLVCRLPRSFFSPFLFVYLLCIIASPAEQLGKELERQKEGLQQEEAAIQINPGSVGLKFDLLLLSSMQEHQVLDGSLPFSQETGCKARPLSKKRFQGETRSSRPSERPELRSTCIQNIQLPQDLRAKRDDADRQLSRVGATQIAPNAGPLHM
jgi:hypothetical protein